MNYDHFRKQVEKRGPAGWQYGCQWLRMRLDKPSGFLFIANKHWDGPSQGEWKGINESSVFMTPSNEMVFSNGTASSQLLGTLGIPGRFRKRNSPLYRHAYEFQLTQDYLAFPGLMVNISTGRPINSRPASSIKVDAKRRKEVDQIIKELRAVILVPCRIGSTAIDVSKMLSEQQRKATYDEDHRSRVLSNLLANDFKANMDQTLKHLTPLLHHFHMNTYRGYGTQSYEALKKAFDNMVAFHKHAVYSHFKVTS